MPKPENFEKLKNSKIIYTGIFNNYRYQELGQKVI